MWNGQQPPHGQHTGYPPPQGNPGGFNFPTAQVTGYQASMGGFAQPPGPPGGYAPPQIPSGGYGPPPGPPGFPPGPAGFPAGFSPGPPGAYSPAYGPPPGGPPPGGPPPGAPPSTYNSPPPFPPPGQAGHPAQQRHQAHPQHHGPPSGGQYAPPPGPPQMPPSQTQHYGPRVEGANHQMQQPYFQYSQCTGRKKALCIGINYIGQSGELRGCHNDARNLVKFLCTHFGYKQDDIVILTDGNRDPRQNPTRANIIAAMQWLVRDARPNDSLFFHYSGHGGQTKDKDGDEGDGYDEVIYPVDYKSTSHIVDDDMHTIMVKPLPTGCRLTAIFDSCHSGSALDLPYIYSTEGKIKEPNLALEAGQGLFSAATSYMRGDMGGVISGVSSVFKSASGSNKKADEYSRRTRTSSADVISWSGCKDSQTSADTVEAGSATGAMSYAFIRALSQNRDQSYSQLLTSLRSILKSSGYNQKPQLSSSHPMDTNVRFIA